MSQKNGKYVCKVPIRNLSSKVVPACYLLLLLKNIERPNLTPVLNEVTELGSGVIIAHSICPRSDCKKVKALSFHEKDSGMRQKPFRSTLPEDVESRSACSYRKILFQQAEG